MAHREQLVEHGQQFLGRDLSPELREADQIALLGRGKRRRKQSRDRTHRTAQRVERGHEGTLGTLAWKMWTLGKA